MRKGLEVGEAQAIVLEATPVLGPETVVAPAALGRVLAEGVVSDRTLPPADCSAMDGFAVRASELAQASPARPVSLPVVFEVPAGGRAPRPLAPGEAARIFTGGPLPPGADTVVRQEDAEPAGGRVAIRVAPGLGDHVRPAGEDVREGDKILAAGIRLHAAHLGMLAALGRSVVAVRQRPRVAILSGGDELVEPDRSVAGGRIVASNSYSLAAQCREAGAEPVYLGIARDRPDEIERGLRAGLRCDVLLSSAGVSVGDHDHVRPVLEKLGCRLAFWGVRMKPGYPLAFGRLDAEGLPLVFGLPGNPVSAMVSFEQFVRPALLKMAGRVRVFRPVVEARLAEPLQKPAGRLHFVRVELARRGAEILATPTGNQSSGVLRSMTEGTGLLVFAAEATRLEAGAVAKVQVLDDEFFAGAEPGI
ncbi:MAG TPA: gephyrin-like molybdotransferase Glp [Myxococcota bacterium]|nr:gephyrin-like molybdotransferase Glp [Myxococcota bacterium]